MRARPALLSVDAVNRAWQCEPRALPHEPSSTSPSHAYASLLGTSPVMKRLREAIGKVAASDRPVLILGPTGSGKELVARTVHLLGRNPEAPLVDLNCGAVPESLIEGQLFGWERGAFTGADRQHEGLLAAAREGVLFLDEIGELDLPLQAKLLRVLETRLFRPLGSTDESAFSGRIVAATNADLEAHVRRGDFREDLYHRLSVLVLRTPSLEERRADIPELLLHFAGRQARPLAFTASALELMMAARWPGNVRQLRNAVDRLAVFADEDTITGETVQEILGDIISVEAEPASLHQLARMALATDAPNKLDGMEHALVVEALARASGNRSEAARLLGVDRKVVERHLAARSRTGARRALTSESKSE